MVDGSGSVGDDNLVGVAAGNGKQMVGRGDNGGSLWHCNGCEGGGELGIGDMDVGDVSGGKQRGERTRLL